jgi:ABC-type nitrate/sulfonate/bicarbonate transport system substrate-binding protein
MLAFARPALAQASGELVIAIASPSLVAALPRIAKEMGLFEKHKLDVRFIIMDSANSATSALISGSVKIAVSGPGELVTAQARGQKMVVIANTYGGIGASLVLAKGNADKLAVTPTASVAERLKILDGMLLASTTATSAYTVALKTAAKAAGAVPRFTYMAQAAMPAALESGAVQGFFTSAPFWAMPVLRGTGVLWISAPRGELPREFTPASSASLQATREFADKNPELMRSLADIVAAFAQAIRDNPAAVKQAVARLYPDLDPPTLDLLFASESIAWQAKRLTPADMAHEIAFVKANGAALPQLDSIDPAALLFP